jgi:hypothetical protein
MGRMSVSGWLRLIVGGALSCALGLGLGACAPNTDDEFAVDADPTMCPSPTPAAGKNVSVAVCRQAWIAGLAIDQQYLYFLAGDTLNAPYANTLKRLPLIGGAVETIAKFGAKHDLPSDTSEDNGSWLAVNSRELVWAVPSTGEILAVSRDGGTPRVLASGQDVPLRVAVDETRAYWTNWSSCGSCSKGSVNAVALAGAEAPVTLAMKQDHPNGIAVDRLNLYWVTAGGNVMQAPLIGGAAITLASGLSNPFFVTVDATTVYWTLPTSVMSCPILGCNKKPTRIASGLKGPNVVSSDANALYFSDWDAGTVLKLVKGKTTPTVIASGLEHPNVVALSTTDVYWHTAGPSGSIMHAPK